MANKLHLACGPVYLEGYINIDIKGHLAKDRPDLVEQNKTTLSKYFKKPYTKRILGHDKRGYIVCDALADVRALPFEDNTIDEILSVNLFEHIRLQDIPTLLQEWRRVLRPNGHLIIDTPDAIGNAKLLLDAKTEEELEWALRLFYCHARDEYDVHHWGYTADYLDNILKHHGFGLVWKKTDFIKHVYPSFQICVEAVK